MITYGKTVGALIRKRRIELGMRQDTLSKKLGWSNKNTQYLSNCELGKNPFPVKHILNISSALWIDKSLIIDAMTSDYNDCLNRETKGVINESQD